MRRFVVILAFVLCCIGLNEAECGTGALSRTESHADAVCNNYDAQLSCQHRYNLNIDYAQTVCVPSCRVSASHTGSRCSSARIIHSVAVGRCAALLGRHSADNPVYPLSLGARAVEYYLYALCRIRI